jgi:dTDP-D-glucose 4,6-dehydratase
MLIPDLPFDVLNIILQYYGRIKYIHKEQKYVNILSKNDYRYNIIKSRMISKVNLINNLNIGNNGLNFYIDVYYKNDVLWKGLIFSKKLL